MARLAMLCLAVLLATAHTASAQLSAGTTARERGMGRGGGGEGGGSSSGSSSVGGGSSSRGEGGSNSFGTLGAVSGVTGTSGGGSGVLIGGSSNGGSNGANSIGHPIDNSNGNGNSGGLIGASSSSGSGAVLGGSGSGNLNGNSNLANKNGNQNGNGNTGGLIGGSSTSGSGAVLGGSGNGNQNGNSNTGLQNGNNNGNNNGQSSGGLIGGSGSGNGNLNSNNNLGSKNGNTNGGNGNSGSNNGNGDGKNNIGSGNGYDNGNHRCAKPGSNKCAGGNSDPVMTGFTGRSFNFFGDVGKTYNLISSLNHQLSARLKLAQMWNHNGTNMDGIGFMYKSYRVLVELQGDEPHVFVNDKELKAKRKKQHHAWRFEDGTAVEMTWETYTPGIGNTVVVSTDVMKVMIWHTPAGIIDEGGKVLEGYINFNITLMAPPENDHMNGIIGDTYERFTVGQEAFNPNSTYYLPEDQLWHGKAAQGDYEMAHYWDTKFPVNLFGAATSDYLTSRSALEVEPAVVSVEGTDSRSYQQQPLRLRRLLIS